MKQARPGRLNCYNKIKKTKLFLASCHPVEFAMTIVELLLLLLVAGICGSIGEAIAGYSAGGCLVSIALGFIGALLGRWLAGILGLPEVFAVQIGGKAFPIVWSIIGSAIFVALISLISYRRRRYY